MSKQDTSECGIGELAREFGITARTIRFYEDRGLIEPARAGTTRVYSARDRVRLELILRGRRLGFSIDEIGELLDLYDAPNGPQVQIERLLRKLDERRKALKQQAADIRDTLKELDEVERRCREVLPVGQEN